MLFQAGEYRGSRWGRGGPLLLSSCWWEGIPLSEGYLDLLNSGFGGVFQLPPGHGGLCPYGSCLWALTLWEKTGVGSNGVWERLVCGWWLRPLSWAQVVGGKYLKQRQTGLRWVIRFSKLKIVLLRAAYSWGPCWPGWYHFYLLLGFRGSARPLTGSSSHSSIPLLLLTTHQREKGYAQPVQRHSPQQTRVQNYFAFCIIMLILKNIYEESKIIFSLPPLPSVVKILQVVLPLNTVASR